MYIPASYEFVNPGGDVVYIPIRDRATVVDELYLFGISSEIFRYVRAWFYSIKVRDYLVGHLPFEPSLRRTRDWLFDSEEPDPGERTRALAQALAIIGHARSQQVPACPGVGQHGRQRAAYASAACPYRAAKDSERNYMIVTCGWIGRI